jgi:hypothetical protein
MWLKSANRYMYVQGKSGGFGRGTLVAKLATAYNYDCRIRRWLQGVSFIAHYQEDELGVRWSVCGW